MTRSEIHAQAFTALTLARELARELCYQANPMRYDDEARDMVRQIANLTQRLESAISETAPEPDVRARQRDKIQILTESTDKLNGALKP